MFLFASENYGLKNVKVKSERSCNNYSPVNMRILWAMFRWGCDQQNHVQSCPWNARQTYNCAELHQRSDFLVAVLPGRYLYHLWLVWLALKRLLIQATGSPLAVRVLLSAALLSRSLITAVSLLLLSQIPAMLRTSANDDPESSNESTAKIVIFFKHQAFY